MKTKDNFSMFKYSAFICFFLSQISCGAKNNSYPNIYSQLHKFEFGVFESMIIIRTKDESQNNLVSGLHFKYIIGHYGFEMSDGLSKCYTNIGQVNFSNSFFLKLNYIYNPGNYILKSSFSPILFFNYNEQQKNNPIFGGISLREILNKKIPLFTVFDFQIAVSPSFNDFKKNALYWNIDISLIR